MRNFNESDYLEDLYYGPEKDYFDEISEIENGGYENFETEEFENPHLAAEVHQAAQRAGLLDLDYVNQQEFFDEIINSDPKDGPYIVDIEESDGYSEFICDDNGNPNLEDARPIYDNLVSGREKGLYGSDCKDDPARALEDVIEGYDMMVSDALLGRNTLSGALKMLYKFKDNPNCPKTKAYFNALANYAEQINAIAIEIGLNDFCIDIPGKSKTLKKEAISFKRPMKESWDENTIANIAQTYVNDYPEGITRMNIVADLENDPYFYSKYDTIMGMDVENQETALADYSNELDNIADAIIEEIKGMGGVINESRRITRKAVLEAKRKNAKSHKAYKMREEEEEEWAWDLKTEKEALKKSMPTASDNEIIIKAAGNVAKKYHTTRAKILATLKPSKGAKTWNKDGKILVKENRNLKDDEAILREDAFTTDIVYVTPYDDPSWYDENGNPVFELTAYPEIAYATACELQKIADPIFIDCSDGDAESGMCAPEPTGIYKMTVAELRTAIENGNLVEDDIDVYTEYDPETQTVIETSKIEDVLSLVFDAIEPLKEVLTKGYCEVSIKAPSGKIYPVNDKSGNPLTCAPDKKSKLEVLAKINKERGKNYTLDQLVFSDVKKK